MTSQRRRQHLWPPASAAVLAASALLTSGLSATEINVGPAVANAGNYQVTWSAEQGSQFVIQEATQSDFSDAVEFYAGPDRGSVVSGRADGVWYYRGRSDAETSWSEPAQVTVEHQPLGRAFLFFGIGLFIFLAVLFVIVKGPGKDAEGSHS